MSLMLTQYNSAWKQQVQDRSTSDPNVSTILSPRAARHSRIVKDMHSLLAKPEMDAHDLRMKFNNNDKQIHRFEFANVGRKQVDMVYAKIGKPPYATAKLRGEPMRLIS